MNCPVCDNPNTPDGADSCAHCGSDLRAFHDIHRLQSQRRTYRTMSIVLGALAIVAISYMAALQMMKTIPEDETHMEQASMALSASAATAEENKLEELESLLVEKDAEISNLQSAIVQLEATMHSSFDDIDDEDHTLHVVKEGETLWSISEMYHGHGFEHASIAGHNELENMDHIEVGDSIIIKH